MTNNLESDGSKKTKRNNVLEAPNVIQDEQDGSFYPQGSFSHNPSGVAIGPLYPAQLIQEAPNESMEVEVPDYVTVSLPQIFWIQCLFDPNINLETYWWPYFYPSFDYVSQICTAHNLPFFSYSYQHCETFNNINLYAARKLWTVNVQTDIYSGYRALSYLLTGSEHNYYHIQNLIYEQIQLRCLPEKFYAVFGEQTTVKSHFLRECDMIIAAALFQINIVIYNYHTNGLWHLINETWILSDNNLPEFKQGCPSILLSFDGHHFCGVLDVRL
jgi:hypothetical protein